MSAHADVMNSRRIARALTFVVLFGSIALSIGLFLFMHQREVENFRALLLLRAERKAGGLHRDLEERRKMAPIAAALFSHLDRLKPAPRDEFTRLADLVSVRLGTINIARRTILFSEEERKQFERELGPLVHLYDRNRTVVPNASPDGVYFPLVDSLQPIQKRDVVVGMPLTEAAMRRAWSEGGCHLSRYWDSALKTYVVTEFAPIYYERTRPVNATSGDAHRRSVKGLAMIISSLPASLAKSMSHYATTPIMRIQAWVPTWSVDLIPPDAVIDERRGVLVGETKQANEDELDSRNEIEV